MPQVDPELFDRGQFQAELALKSSPIAAFKKAIRQFREVLDNRFNSGRDIRRLIEDRAWCVDQILQQAWQRFDWGDDADIALVAVGGYGRGELHPYSDVDLLILLDSEDQESFREPIEGFLTLLWDIGLEVGQSVRSVQQCAEEARADLTVITTLMECRTICGPDSLRQRMLRVTGSAHMWPSKEFFLAKRHEQQRRHAKYNDTEYNLEPNVKGSPGGLRDIQTILWMARRQFGSLNLHALVREGFLVESECSMLASSQEFLWRVRYALHMLAGRAEDRLLFDHQRSIARLFGYEDNDVKLAVERFMQKYYRVVMAISELNDLIIQHFEEVILPCEQPVQIQPLNSRFQLRDGYIEVTHPNVFKRTPFALLEIFVLMAQHPEIKGVRADTIRLLRDSRHLIDDEFRHDIRNTSLFIELFKSSQGIHRNLRRMNRYGILGRYLPEFGHIIGQMQHDLFHIYTVDAHTLNLIKHLRKLNRPEMAEKYPLASKIIDRLPKPELIYIAGLYHDIAKGRGGDHSELGAVDAEAFCQSHQLPLWDTQLVSWLVQNHLVMSTTAQRKDLSDPQVIFDFAQLVGDQTHLDYLYVLTVADINATNPTLWNSWRASLLRQLYTETKRRPGEPGGPRGADPPDADRGPRPTGTQRHRPGRCRAVMEPARRRLLPAPHRRRRGLAHRGDPPAPGRRHAAGADQGNHPARVRERFADLHLRRRPARFLRGHRGRHGPAQPEHPGRADHHLHQPVHPRYLYRARRRRRLHRQQPGAHRRDPRGAYRRIEEPRRLPDHHPAPGAAPAQALRLRPAGDHLHRRAAPGLGARSHRPRPPRPAGADRRHLPGFRPVGAERQDRHPRRARGGRLLHHRCAQPAARRPRPVQTPAGRPGRAAVTRQRTGHPAYPDKLLRSLANAMNTALDNLQPYPFEKLRALLGGARPPATLKPIALSIGEPKHRSPSFVAETLAENLDQLAVYPTTLGLPALREAIARWCERRFSVPAGWLDAARHVLPVNGTREALFAFTQTVVRRSEPGEAPGLVVSPNPFYQIYEGAALLAGAVPHYLPCREENGFNPDFDAVDEATWQRCQILFLCSPGNPTGALVPLETLKKLIALADRYDFVIAADECYSELYFDENAPPPGLLNACAELGRTDFSRCVVFHSLSKRSNLPGLRSGFVAGDAEILKKFLLYRTYHGCAMPVQTQLASIAAWNDEVHVRANRSLYREKFDAVLAILDGVLDVQRPDGSFYLWARTPVDDTVFTRELFEQQHVTVVPGSYLSREVDGENPGANRVRMALVAPLAECVEAAERIRDYLRAR